MTLSVNSYFNDAVKSIAFESANGPCTAGVMLPGDYVFGTSQDELMKVTEGALTVKLPGQSDWQTFEAGTEFRVAANQSFDVKVATTTAYLCFYS